MDQKLLLLCSITPYINLLCTSTAAPVSAARIRHTRLTSRTEQHLLVTAGRGPDAGRYPWSATGSSNHPPNKAGRFTPSLGLHLAFRSRPGRWWLDRDHQIESIQSVSHHQPSIRPPTRPAHHASPCHRDWRITVTGASPPKASFPCARLPRFGPTAGKPNRGLPGPFFFSSQGHVVGAENAADNRDLAGP